MLTHAAQEDIRHTLTHDRAHWHILHALTHAAHEDTYGTRWHMIQHTDTYSTVSPYKSSNHLLRYFMYHLTVLRFEAWSSSRRYTSPVTNFSEHLHVTLKYTHRPIHQLETCYAQRLTQFDVSATSGSNNLKPMFSLLSKFLQKTAVRFCTILCQLFIDIFWRRREGRKKHRTEVRKCPHGDRVWRVPCVVPRY